MKIVVTGATSFIGAVTVRQLLEAGHQVYGVVRPGSANLTYLTSQVPETAKGRLQVIYLNLSKISQIGSQSVNQADAWIHIGWDGAGSDNRTRRDVQQDNVRHSLEAVKAAAALGCRRFLFTGSQAEYGVYHQQIHEELPCHPVSEYGIAKVDFYRQAEPLCRELGMDYLHARIFSVYGPGDHPWSLVQSCLKTWQEGGLMKLGECTQQWNFLYIEDAVAALLHVLTEGKAGVYNIAGQDTRPLRSFIEEMYEICGQKGSFRYGARPQNAEGPADLIPDIGKILRETNWRPKTTFSEGIYETLHRLQA